VEFLQTFNESLASDTKVPIEEKAIALNSSPIVTTSSEQMEGLPQPPVQPPMPAPSRFKEPEVAGVVIPTETKLDSQKNELNKNTDSLFSRFHLLSFQTGVFFSKLYNDKTIRAVSAAWTPVIPVPWISFLSFRGHFGGQFALQGSLNEKFLVREFQVFLSLSIFSTVFLEAGAGEQIWVAEPSLDGQLRTINAGLLTRLGPISRIFIGYQELSTMPHFEQFKAGIGITF
jgi:hypothetical protein